MGACHEEGVARPSFALPGEKTSGQTKVKGLKLQEGQFWLKIEKPRMGEGARAQRIVAWVRQGARLSITCSGTVRRTGTEA